MKTAESKVFIGTVFLGVVGSGVALVEGTIMSLVVGLKDGSAVHTEIQDQEIVAGRGYASLSLGSRARRLDGEPAEALVHRLQRRAPRRELQACDPCASRVWGDFSGDCRYLASDVDYLARFLTSRLRCPARACATVAGWAVA